MRSAWLMFAVLGCSNTQSAPCRPGTERGASGYCENITNNETSTAPAETADSTDTGSVSPGYAADTAASHVDVQYPSPTWTKADLETEIGILFRENHPQIAPIFALWRSMFVGRDSTCPGDGYNIQVPMSGCITSHGWRYTGPASYEEIETPMEDTILLNADTHIIDNEDNLLIFVGTAAASTVNDLGVEHWKIDMRGMIEYMPSDIPWIANGTSMMIFGGGDVGGRVDLIAGWSTEETVVSMDIKRATDCEGISGTMWLQDPAGPKHVLHLDCSPCATWQWEDGSTLGEVCLDNNAISEWMDSLGRF